MRTALAQAKTLAAEGQVERALDMVRAAAAPEADLAVLSGLSRWLRSLPDSETPEIKIAFLGGGTLDQFVELTGAWLRLYGLKLVPYLAAYDTWRMEVLAPESALYKFTPDLVWFFTTSHDWPQPGRAEISPEAAGQAAGETESLWELVRNKMPKAQIIQNNMEAVPERIFGNLDASVFAGRANFQARLNLDLTEKAAAQGVVIFDLNHLAASQGLWKWADRAYWHHSKHPFAPDLAGWVGFYAAKLVLAARGLAKKVVVLDLDNTLWGGVVGDDGLEGLALGNNADGEAFAAFQYYLKGLSRRGIVLAVASKNNEDAAQEPFKSHPAMVLTLDDIAVFKTNWRNKADNIREIAETLRLGLDSFVFVDDNPAERALVRQELPMVETPELPENPSLYEWTLDRMAYFESLFFSEEDRKRARMYKENASRVEIRKTAANLGDYLLSLQMVAESGPADQFHLPRMSQLVNKSNQFHLTTTRYSEAELRDLASRDDIITRWFGLADRFGDYGLVSVLVLKLSGGEALIDTWAMSCRVLERGMEEFVIRDLIREARKRGARRLVGLYKPSQKNFLVAGLYERLGFEALASVDPDQSRWAWDLSRESRTAPLLITPKEK
jgi:FkbH-like protein